MPRVLLSALLCGSFVTAQAHVLRERSLRARALAVDATGECDRPLSTGPCTDHLGAGTARAILERLNFDWQARPNLAAEPAPLENHEATADGTGAREFAARMAPRLVLRI